MRYFLYTAALMAIGVACQTASQDGSVKELLCAKDGTMIWARTPDDAVLEAAEAMGLDADIRDEGKANLASTASRNADLKIAQLLEQFPEMSPLRVRLYYYGKAFCDGAMSRERYDQLVEDAKNG